MPMKLLTVLGKYCMYVSIVFVVNSILYIFFSLGAYLKPT